MRYEGMEIVEIMTVGKGTNPSKLRLTPGGSSAEQEQPVPGSACPCQSLLPLLELLVFD